MGCLLFDTWVNVSLWLGLLTVWIALHRTGHAPVLNLSAVYLSVSISFTHTCTHISLQNPQTLRAPDPARQKLWSFCCPSQLQKHAKREDKQRLEWKGFLLRGGKLPDGPEDSVSVDTWGPARTPAPGLAGPWQQIQARQWNMPAWA